ncbi:MAG: hypothetical protein NVSMB32_01040 [Actinomycetota bacterium]
MRGWALYSPSHVIAIDLADSRLDAAKRFGADVVVNNGRQDAATVVRELTEGLGADVAIEAVGLPPRRSQGGALGVTCYRRPRRARVRVSNSALSISPRAKRRSRISFALPCGEFNETRLIDHTRKPTTAPQKTTMDSMPNHNPPPLHPHIIASLHSSLTDALLPLRAGRCLNDVPVGVARAVPKVPNHRVKVPTPRGHLRLGKMGR